MGAEFEPVKVGIDETLEDENELEFRIERCGKSRLGE